MAYGTCGHFVKGPPANAKTHGTLTPREAGYMINRAQTGYGCKRCLSYLPGIWRCRQIDRAGEPDFAEIHPEAHCTAWEYHPRRGPLTNEQLLHGGIYDRS